MKGILMNTEYCTGCHSCEVACKKRVGTTAEGEFGIKLTETGPWKSGHRQSRRRMGVDVDARHHQGMRPMRGPCAKGKMPMCVQHCQAWCMYHGEVEDLAKKMDGKTRWVLLTR